MNTSPPMWDINDLLDTDPREMDAEEVLEFIKAAQEVQSMLESVRLEGVDRYADLKPNGEWTVDSLACETKTTPARAGRDMALSYVLRRRLPKTLAALRAGKLDRARVDQIDFATTVLSEEKAREVDARLHPDALEMNPRQLADRARKLVVAVDPEGAAERARAREEERRVAVQHEEDGMSWINALLASEDAVACWDRIDSIAKDLNTADEPRSMNQLRADALRDVILGVNRSHVQAHVYVTFNASTLLGLDNLPGDLRGYGYLPADRVRDLAFQLKALWTGVLVDEDGHAKAVHEKKYRLRGHIAELIRLQSPTCDHPACGRPAEKCDLDHRLPHDQGGLSNEENCGPRCRRHHRAKQSPYWTVTRNPDGTITWTNTEGHPHTKNANPPHPPSWTTPHPFEALDQYPSSGPDQARRNLSRAGRNMTKARQLLLPGAAAAVILCSGSR